jgi:CRP-like cAMP-binding protein
MEDVSLTEMETQAALQQLTHLTELISPLSESDRAEFLSMWEPFSAKRKAVITEVGNTESWLYFVVSGVQRVYYFDGKGREATLVFTYNPSFGGVLDSFMEQKPSAYSYETLTASTFLRARFTDLDGLMNNSPAVSTMIRKGLTGVLSGIFERIIELQCFSSEDKFRSLLKRSPHILHLVPHKYLANYLGIDPTNFSKFINTVKI